jgi:P27 family predicted phage terminase small subunit
MARGRKANPAQSNVIKGTFRADRHTHGPAVDIGLPPCPKWLPKRGRKHWAITGALLERHGLISIVDGDVFALHCDSVGWYEEICGKLKELDDFVDTTPQGYEVQAVLLQIRNKLHDQIIKTAREFGLTPSARASLKVQTPQGNLFGDGWDSV